MARAKKNGKNISLLLDEELYKKLEKYCVTTYLTKTAAIEKALTQMFDRENVDDMPEPIVDCGGIRPLDTSFDD